MKVNALVGELGALESSKVTIDTAALDDKVKPKAINLTMSNGKKVRYDFPKKSTTVERLAAYKHWLRYAKMKRQKAKKT